MSRKRDLQLKIKRSDKDGKFRGAVVSGNGEIMAVSRKVYKSRDKARHDLCKAFKKGVATSKVYMDKALEWRFKILVDGDQLFKSSEGHKSRSYTRGRVKLILSLRIV